ncbi:MAG: MFS transporter [Anaerolineales bacterium]|nr:MFS transporter [Anaerolineales bacterium]
MRIAIQRSIGYFLTFVCLGMDMAVVGPTLPALAGQTGSTLGAIGMVFLLSAGGATLGTLLGSWIFDKVSGRVVLAAAQIGSAALMFLVPHVPWIYLLMVLFVVKGVAGGLVNTGANTLMLWTHREKSAPFVTALHFFFGLGSFISPFLLGLLLGAGGAYADGYHLLAVFDLLVGVIILAFLRPPASPQKKAEPGAAVSSGRFVVPLVLSAMLYLFFYVSAEITFGGWVYTYAITLNLADAVRAAYLTSIFWLAFTIGRLIAIPAAVRFAPWRVIAVALAGCAGFLGLLVLFPGAPSVVWITAAGAGFCMAPVWPSGYTLAGQSVNLTARLSGFILLGDSIGGMILPGLTGWIMEAAGAPAMAQLVLASLVATFLAYLGILYFGKRRKETVGTG